MYGTQTQSWTITHARRVTAKLAADLDLMHSFYGYPPADDVTAYAEEAAMLLAKRYLGTVEYGFKRNGAVVFALKYTAKSDGTLSGDDRAGRVPADLDLNNASFYSWLTYSAAWTSNLDAAGRASFEKTLPVQRTSGSIPSMAIGTWSGDRSYSTNGEGVTRSTFRAI